VEEQFMREYARKFGRTHEEIHQYFVREQETLSALFTRSTMPKLSLQNDGASENVIAEAGAFWSDEIDKSGEAAAS
jgi:hypothetical protein